MSTDETGLDPFIKLARQLDDEIQAPFDQLSKAYRPDFTVLRLLPDSGHVDQVMLGACPVGPVDDAQTMDLARQVLIIDAKYPYGGGEYPTDEHYFFKQTRANVGALDLAERLEELLSVGGRRAYVSLPVQVHGHVVAGVIRIDDGAARLTPALATRRTGQFSREATSLVDGLVDSAFDHFLDGVWQVRCGSADPVVNVDSHQLLRGAAAALLRRAMLIGTDNAVYLDLLDSLESLSAMSYEQGATDGGLILSNETGASKAAIELSPPVLLKNVRTVRKLLEVTRRVGKESLFLFSDGYHIRGVGPSLEVERVDVTETNFVVRFSGRSTFSFECGIGRLMLFKDGLPSLPHDRHDSDLFRRLVARMFAITDDQARTLDACVVEACRQRHGAMVVVCENAKAESERLSEIRIGRWSAPETSSYIANLCSMDGAVMLDTAGRCHGAGVILDGPALDAGRADRGARFNSARRYVQARREKLDPCVAVVVSSDGMVDVFPKLRPFVSMAEIQNRLDELASVAASHTEDAQALIELLEWFHERRNHLETKSCDRINAQVDDLGSLKRDVPFRLLRQFKQEVDWDPIFTLEVSE